MIPTSSELADLRCELYSPAGYSNDISVRLNSFREIVIEVKNYALELYPPLPQQILKHSRFDVLPEQWGCRNFCPPRRGPSRVNHSFFHAADPAGKAAN